MAPLRGSDQDLLVKAAWLYYVHGQGQEQVAKALHLSRTKVTRLLSHARESGIVKISVEHETVETLALADWIASRYGVENCILTPPLPEDPAPSAAIEAINRQSVGMAAANVLMRRCLSNRPMTIGVGAGRTVARVIDSIVNLTKSDLTALSLIGTTHRDEGISSYSLALLLSDAVGGKARTLPTPIYMGSPASRQALERDPVIAELLQATAQTDINILSCGPAKGDSSFSMRAGLTEEDGVILEKADVACELAGFFLKADGSFAETPLNDRRIGVSFETLKATDNIVVASGTHKAEPLKAVMAAGIAKTIVIDNALAGQLARR